MSRNYSIIIPVYNRPDEVEELLHSLTKQSGKIPFEVVIVEDGSPNTSEKVVQKFEDQLEIQYFLTENQGAGKSRNYGMQKAKGNYFIIFDSDCLIPSEYMNAVDRQLNENYTDAFGGPDAAHDSFTQTQKAINYAMTSFLTTGGIRGKQKAVGKFQPRSFNLGISKKAFEQTQGFSAMKIGEDIDLTFRLWNAGFETQLISGAFVYHKRRVNFSQFYKQTHNFGKARPVLNKKYPGSAKITYWFPAVYLLGLLSAIILTFMFSPIFIVPISVYLLCVLLHSSYENKSISVGIKTVGAVNVQFYGYGLGFLQSVCNNFLSKKENQSNS